MVAGTQARKLQPRSEHPREVPYVDPPCRQEYIASDGAVDWTAAPPVYDRLEAQRRATRCLQECTLYDECERLAGVTPKHNTGIWHSYLYKDGERIDPFGLDEGDHRSIYRNVYWQPDRRKWRAVLHLKGKRYNLGGFVSEDEAGVAIEKLKDSLDLDGLRGQ